HCKLSFAKMAAPILSEGGRSKSFSRLPVNLPSKHFLMWTFRPFLPISAHRVIIGVNGRCDGLCTSDSALDAADGVATATPNIAEFFFRLDNLMSSLLPSEIRHVQHRLKG